MVIVKPVFSEMEERGFKVTVSFCSLVKTGCNSVTETVKDRQHAATRREDGICHDLYPLEIFKNGGYPDYVTWNHKTKACAPKKFLRGPASLKRNRSIVYPCEDGKCIIGCPCWICLVEVEHPPYDRQQKYQEHLLYHHAPHLSCEFCLELLRVFSSPTYSKQMKIYTPTGPFSSVPKSINVQIKAYIFRHSFNENRGCFRKKEAASKKGPNGQPCFKCEDCDKQFTKACNLNRHIMNQHYGSKFQCKDCLKYFSRKDKLKEHSKIHMGELSESDFSDGYGNDSDVSDNHLSDEEMEENEDIKQDEVCKRSKLQCESCDKTFERKYNLKRHVKNVHEIADKVTCPSCKKCFRGKYELDRHIKTMHDQPCAFSCSWCGMKFKRQDYLLKHRQAGLTEDDEVKYQCKECDKIHCTLRSLQYHQRKEHPKFLCDICSKSFSRKFNLEVHRKMEKFPCDICHLLFCTADDKVFHDKDEHD